MSKSSSEEIVVEIPLKWEGGENLSTVYSNQVYVTHAGPEFYIVFGEMRLPHANIKEPPTEIPVKVVARVAIPFEMMEQLVAAVSINYDNFKKSSRK